MVQALTRDLGLDESSSTLIKNLTQGPIDNDPLGEMDELSSPEDIALSTGGSIALLAYWVFSSTVFEADHPLPDMNIFPEHFALLDQLLQDDAHGKIMNAPGTIAAMVALGLWLQENGRFSSGPVTDNVGGGENPSGSFMTYHHLLTLVAVYHPSLHVRNAASSLAGAILHADPDSHDRLRILEDLLENCMFTNLKACAVTWLREEMIAAASASDSSPDNVFTSSDALDSIQYAVFPSLAFLKEEDQSTLVEYFTQNAGFLHAAANFAIFLWGGDGPYKELVPEGMDSAVGERWAEPLLSAIKAYLKAGTGKEHEERGDVNEVQVLQERLSILSKSGGFSGLQ